MALGIEYDAVIRREIWVKHYCSSHRILLVGEGDFSFSLSLAQSFGSASNIVASSLDSYAELIKMYKQANSNLVKLVKLGADLFHEVDATKMDCHPDLKMRKFDRIIFNFPHAGFYGKEDNILLIQMHREVVHGFLRNARDMLRDNGEIHVNHKTTYPYNQWNLEELASQNSLALIDCVDFRAEDHPGYNNKRGQGPDGDDSFRLGACSTYKFGLSPHTKKMPKVSSSLDTARITFQNFVQPPIETVRQPIAAVPQPIVPYEFRQSQTNFAPYANNIPGYVVSQPTVGIRNECSRIFPGYFSHVTETFRRNDCEGDVYDSVHRALNLGFATYMAEVPGRDLSGHIELLEELHRRRDSRLAWLEWERTLVSHHQR